MIVKSHAGIVLAVMMSVVIAGGRARASEPMPSRSAYSVGADAVTAALAARGLSVAPSQVEFLASVRSIRPNPALEIEHLQAAGQRSLLVRVRCRETADCLPFFVVVHLSDRQDVEAMLERMPATARLQPAASRPSRPNWMLRQGETAMFVLENKDLRASAPVICLQNGRQGDSIRVSSLDHKRIMIGEIVGPGLLRAYLQEAR